MHRSLERIREKIMHFLENEIDCDLLATVTLLNGNDYGSRLMLFLSVSLCVAANFSENYVQKVCIER